MIRYFIIRVLLPLAVFLLLRSILRSVFQTGRDLVRSEQQPPQPPPSPSAGGELKKDPVCGTYVSTSVGLTRKMKGETVYFCSKECRDKFVA